MNSQINQLERLAAMEALFPMMLASVYDETLLRAMLAGWTQGRDERAAVVLIPIVERSMSDCTLDRTIAFLEAALAVRTAQAPVAAFACRSTALPQPYSGIA